MITKKRFRFGKRLLSLFLAAFLVIGILPVASVFAELSPFDEFINSFEESIPGAESFDATGYSINGHSQILKVWFYYEPGSIEQDIYFLLSNETHRFVQEPMYMTLGNHTVSEGELYSTVIDSGIYYSLVKFTNCWIYGDENIFISFGAGAHNIYGSFRYFFPQLITVAFVKNTMDINVSGPTPYVKQVAFGATYGPLATISRGGYTFLGWFFDEAGTGEEVTETTIVANNFVKHNLYAKWSPDPDEDENVTVVGVETNKNCFVGFAETAKNSHIWDIVFNVSVTYSDGSTAMIPITIYVSSNNSNLSGSYTFNEGLLEGYTLVYDIKGNGSNIKDFRLILSQ